MKKKVLCIILALALIVGAVVFLLSIFTTSFGSSKNGRRDTYGKDITYYDEARQIPIDIRIDFDVEYGSDEEYTFMLLNEDAKVSYDAELESGSVSILINDGETVVEEFVIDKSGTGIFDKKFKTNYAYTMRIKIESGKGKLRLNWEG